MTRSQYQCLAKMRQCAFFQIFWHSSSSHLKCRTQPKIKIQLFFISGLNNYQPHVARSTEKCDFQLYFSLTFLELLIFAKCQMLSCFYTDTHKHTHREMQVCVFAFL